MDCKMLAVARREIERPTERYDELSGRRIMPGESATRCRLLERNPRGTGLSAQQVATRSARQVDRAFLEARIAVSRSARNVS